MTVQRQMVWMFRDRCCDCSDTDVVIVQSETDGVTVQSETDFVTVPGETDGVTVQRQVL